MARPRLSAWLVAAACALGAVPARPHVQPQTGDGAGFHWAADDLPVSFVLNDQGSDDIPDASDDVALREGFAAWSDVTYADFSYVEDASPASRARTDWEADDIHLVLFDEDDSSGLFPAGSGLLAITVLEVDEVSGEILDGDVLLNGADFGFTTDPDSGDFDLWSLASHEAGHLAGLGHSPLGGATMAPFLDPGRAYTRSLTADDACGLETLYPAGVRAEISGSVRRGGGAPVSGAHVWLVDQAKGALGPSTLTDADGAYRLAGLEPGPWVVFAGPLDASLSPDDLDNPGQPFLDTFFQPVQGAQVTITGVESVSGVDLTVPDDSALTVTGPLTALSLHQGGTAEVELEVTGFSAISSVTVPYSNVVEVESFSVDGTTLTVELSATLSAPMGLYDLQVQSSLGTLAILTGFVDVLPPAPVLTSATPPCGGNAGAEEIQVLGQFFGSAPRALFGDVFGEVTFVGPGGGALLVQPPEGLPTGPVDLVLLTAEDQQLVVPDPYVFVDGGVPVIDSIFPAAGTTLGGTEVTLLGSGFGPDSLVFFGNDQAASVTLDSSEQLTVITPVMADGLLDVTVIYADCVFSFAVADDAFDAIGVPDPEVHAITPDTIEQPGGDLLTIDGDHFVDGAQVELFGDSLSGTGATVLATTFVSPTQLTATAPAGPLPGGFSDVVVRLPTNQAGVLPDGLYVDAPQITAVDPGLVARTGGDTITVTGSDFDGTAVVELFTDLETFTGGTALATTFVDSGTLTAVLPDGPLPGGPANVSVSMAGPKVAGLADALLLADPTLDTVSPDTVEAAGGQTLTLTGFGFEPGAVVEAFADPIDLSGGTPLATTYVDSDTLTAVLPEGPLPVGQGTLVVQLLGGALKAALVDGLEVLAEIHGVGPSVVAQTGGDTLTVTGTGFQAGTVVEVFNNLIDYGGGTELVTTVVDEGTLTAVLPAGPLPLGPANLVVQVPGGLPVGLADAFTVDPPRLDAVTPTTITVTGGDTLTLTGFGFVDGAVATLFADEGDFTGGTPLATTFVDGGTLTAVTPDDALLPEGLATVAVELPGGLAVGLVDAVSVTRHTIEAVSPDLISHVGGEELVITGSLFEPGAVVELGTDPVTFSGGTALATTFVSATELRAVTPEGGVLEPGPITVGVRLPGDSLAVAEGLLEVATFFESGDKGSGALGADDTSDALFVDGLVGSLVTVQVKRLGKGSTLVPAVTLFGPDGDELLSSDPASIGFDAELTQADEKKARMKNYLLPETGRYTLRVERLDGEGAYRVQYIEKVDKALTKVKFNNKAPGLVGPGEDLVVALPAKGQSQVLVKLNADKNSDLLLGLDVHDHEGGLLLSVEPDGTLGGDPDWVAATKVLKDGLKLLVKKPRLPGFGTATVTVRSGNGGSGAVKGVVSFKPPRLKQSFDTL